MDSIKKPEEVVKTQGEEIKTKDEEIKIKDKEIKIKGEEIKKRMEVGLDLGRHRKNCLLTLFLFMQAMSSVSSRSGRKRAAEVGWDQIISGLVKDLQTRTAILEHIHPFDGFTPLSFLQSSRKSQIVQAIGMEGWEDQVTEAIATVSFRLMLRCLTVESI